MAKEIAVMLAMPAMAKACRKEEKTWARLAKAAPKEAKEAKPSRR